MRDRLIQREYAGSVHPTLQHLRAQYQKSFDNILALQKIQEQLEDLMTYQFKTYCNNVVNCGKYYQMHELAGLIDTFKYFAFILVYSTNNGDYRWIPIKSTDYSVSFEPNGIILISHKETNELLFYPTHLVGFFELQAYK